MQFNSNIGGPKRGLRVESEFILEDNNECTPIPKSATMVSPGIGAEYVTNEHVAEENKNVLKEELNREILEIDHTSPIKFLEESSGEKKEPSPINLEEIS